MRHFIGSSLVVAAAVVFMSGPAFAVSTSIEYTFGTATGLGTDGTLNENGELEGLEVGSEFEVSITLDNSGTNNSDIQSVFTFLNYNASAIEIVNGFALAPAGEVGFIGNSLAALGSPAPAAGQPAGFGVGIALGVSNPTTGDGFWSLDQTAVVAVAIFRVVGPGDIGAIGQFEIFTSDTGNSAIFDPATGNAQQVQFGGPLGGTFAVIPEPGTALLMGLGLSGLALSGRRRA